MQNSKNGYGQIETRNIRSSYRKKQKKQEQGRK